MHGANPRSCIYVRNYINASHCWSSFRNVAVVRILHKNEETQRECPVTSVYLQNDSDKPPPMKETREITDYCSSRRKQPITRCDVNTNHNIWGSNDINPRWESRV
jgi:hypothetical protein